jgi:hypothetical protein
LGEFDDALAEGEVGCQDIATALMVAGLDVEPQFAALPTERHEPSCINDQQFAWWSLR